MINLPKKLLRVVGRTNAHFGMIGEGDKVLVGLSGGKDSLTLVHWLAYLKQHAPFSFDYQAVTISYGMGEDLHRLQEHCAEHNIPHVVHNTEIFDIAQDHIRPGSSFCSFFSRMRRGSLYTYALENGFNKLALGHHLDDAVETFFMSLTYNGTFRSMAPMYKAENGLIVVRPLIKIREKQTRFVAETHNLPTVGDEACPSMKFAVKMPYARAKTKEWLEKWEEENSDLFKMVASAFEHIQDDTFFDKERLKI